MAEVVMALKSMAVAVVEEGDVTEEGDRSIALMTGVVVMVAETMTAEGVEGMTAVVQLNVVTMASL